MSGYKRLYRSDVVSTPYVANKEWSISVCDLDSYGIRIYNGVNSTGSFDYQNSTKTNNEYDKLVYDSINSLYYQEFSGSYLDNTSLLQSLSYESASIYRPSGSYYNYTPEGYMIKQFPTGSNAEIKVLSISKDVFGQSLQKMSFNISTSFCNLQDDGKGNVYDVATNPDTLVGNIFYEHGNIIITHPDYQQIFPVAPDAKDDYYKIRISQSPYTIYPLANDDTKGRTALTASIVLSGSSGPYFSVVGNGSVYFTGTVPGSYETYYKFSAGSTASFCSLESNYAKILVDVVRPMCNFNVYVKDITPPATPTPTPTNTPTPSPTPTPTASATPTPTPTPTPVPIVFDAEYIVGTYTFLDGLDLDTRTRVVTPDVGQTYTGSYAGWSQVSYWPTSSDAPISGSPMTSSNRPYLVWGGDNTGTGLEAVLFDVTRFKQLHPSASDAVIDFRCFWFSATGSLPVQLDIQAYSGSHMIFNGMPYGFTYAGTFPTASVDSGLKYITAYRSGSVVTGSSDLENPSVAAAITRGQRLATLSYSLTGKTGSINISDITTPVV